MAIFNEILAGRFNRALQKIFAIKVSPPVRQLGGEIMPVHQVASGVEHRAMEGWDRFAASVNAPGAPGTNAGVQLRNPVGSGALVVIEKIVLSSTTSGVMHISQAVFTLNLLNVFVGFRMDSRGRPQSAAVPSSSSGTTDLAVQQQSHNLVANVDNYLIANENQEWPLLPGDTLRFVAVTVNVNMDVELIWRERTLEESEAK